MPQYPIKGRPYGNNRVLSVEGELLFRCSDKRVEWYLDRNLAEVVEGAKPRTIRLKFVTNGPGNAGDEFGLAERKCVCVVCGSENNLSRHHVVPSCYRTYFPDDIKSHNCHDVLLTCLKCHNNYERLADNLKAQLAAEYDAPLYGDRYEEILLKTRAISYANNLLKHQDTIPYERQLQMIDFIKDVFELETVDLKAIAAMSDSLWTQRTHGEIVVEKIADLHDFVVLWRKHFVDTMKPKYMPVGWSVDYKTRECRIQECL